uniref:DUF1659 domain-containing protein n=1 Tax=Coprothermobacter proteolyticus (strain ATCC 35245 / DSM 5265 / OCM 4 / BT) TaxID=309798 RepID=B5Y7N1_COPPD
MWLNSEGKKRLWSLNNIDPTATATSIMELTNALGTLTTRVTTGVQLMVVNNLLP